MSEFLIPLALIGTTLIVVRGTIFRPIQRLWPAFFQCSQCVGFWIGVAAGASAVITTRHGLVLDSLIVGASTSFLSMLSDAVLINLLGAPSPDEEVTKP
jgi:hypothetical protein